MKRLLIIIFPISMMLFVAACGSGEEREKTSSEKESLSLTEDQEKYYLETGNKITSAVFSVLSGELMGAMQADGVQGAMAYCNLQAYPLTDSLSNEFDAHIIRLAERYRNPDNRLQTEMDRKVFEEYDKMDADRLPTAERVKLAGDKSVIFYKPIPLQPQCMACHGPKSAIGEENLAYIRELYPEDKAINFAPGDLRGMWRVEIKLRTDL